jgi:hypothetical protein
MSAPRSETLFLWRILLICLVPITDSIKSGELYGEWTDSSKLEQWYTPLDICLLRNDTSSSLETIMKNCEAEVKSTTFQPIRCRAGNSWPSKGGFCSSEDIPYSERVNLRRSIEGFDDPSVQPLKKLFSLLSEEKGALLLIGDSVMQQYYSAMACELEREGMWKDPSQFKNTDALRHVIPESKDGVPGHSVPIRFTPIYHFVNGKYDRVVSTYSILYFSNRLALV